MNLIREPLRLLSMVLPLCTPVLTQAATDLASTLSQMLDEATQGHYVEPTPAALSTAESLFAAELEALDPQWLDAQWDALGFERMALRHPECADCVVIQEQPWRREGRGWFLLRPRSSSRIALQLPHSRKDLDTGAIGVRLAAEHAFLAAAWNTVRRDQPTGVDGRSADLAHLPHSYFNALTRALAASGRMDHLVQIHGFAQSKRRTQAGRRSEVIVSAGARPASIPARSLSACLRERLSPQTRLYPDEVLELGARTNVQGAIVRSTGRSFLHVELNRDLRRRLRHELHLRTQLLDCLPG